MATPAKPQVDEETPLESDEYGNSSETELEKPILEEEVATVATTKTGGKTKPKTKEEDDQVSHSPRILKMCKQLNITDDEIEGLSPEALEVFISREMKRQLAAAKQEGREEREIETKKKQKKEEEAEDGIEWGEFVDESGTKRKATDADIHDGMLPVIKMLVKEVRELKGNTTKQAKSTQEERLAQLEAAFDKSCSRFKKTLGTGTLSQLDGTPFAKKRVAMFSEVCNMLTKDRSMTVDEAVEHVCGELYGVKLQNPTKPVVDEEDEGAARRQSYAQSKTVRPQARKGKKPRGKEAAEDAIGALMEEYLGDSDADDDSDSEY